MYALNHIQRKDLNKTNIKILNSIIFLFEPQRASKIYLNLNGLQISEVSRHYLYTKCYTGILLGLSLSSLPI